MNCLKCGREVSNKAIFCPDCQADMEKNPVKPGTTVYIPTRKDATAPKAHAKKKELSPELQIKRLKRANRWLFCLLLLVSIALGAFGLLFQDALEEAYNSLPMGQNYSAETTPATGR